MGTVTLSSARSVGAPPEAVFALLADLRRHWPLLGDALEHAEMIGEAESALLVARLGFGRWALRRRIVTHVLESRRPWLLAGRAHAGGGTHARIEWRVSESEAGALVRFAAEIEPRGLGDRLLVRLALPLLRRRCEDVLRRLGDAVEAGGASVQAVQADVVRGELVAVAIGVEPAAEAAGP